jgi:hypothetical protein
LKEDFPDSLEIEYIEATSFNKIKQEVESIYQKWEANFGQPVNYVVHYLGHAMLENQVGKLVFKNPDTGKPDWYEDKRFASLFNEDKLNIQQPCLVSFQACDSAKIGSFNETLRGVAYEFTKINIPAVIGMQNEIDTPHSCAFFNRFYENILKGKDVAEAVTAGRDYLGREFDETEAYINNSFGSPVLFITTSEPVKIIRSADQQQINATISDFNVNQNLNSRNMMINDRTGQQAVTNVSVSGNNPERDTALRTPLQQNVLQSNADTDPVKIAKPNDALSPGSPSVKNDD